MATNTLHNALCITLNLFKNLRLRIAIVRSAWRQPNISKHTFPCHFIPAVARNTGDVRNSEAVSHNYEERRVDRGDRHTSLSEAN